ncbi:MAG: P-loop NTPase fold protein, partial [Chloroflexota bacterium]
MVDSMLQKSGRNVHDPIETLDQDLLGRQVLAETILNRLASEDVGVLGIYGGWGTGKSSLLKLICELNEKCVLQAARRDIQIEIIDAWKYESLGSLLIPIIVRLKKLTGDIALQASWQRIIKRAFATASLTVVDAMLKKVAALDRQNIKENLQLVQQHEKQNDHSAILLKWKDWSDDVEGTENAFRAVINSILTQHGYSRLVLCIDNLDRCSPETAISLLESVKNFLTVSGCVWVFAVDSEVIASYIDKKYEGTAVNGYSFLDKIIPEQYHLALSPTLDWEKMNSLLGSVAGRDSDAEINISKIPQIPRLLVPRRLIKSARKVADFYRNPKVGVSPETIIALSLLYHTWPDFYQRLTSASKEHIQGMLDNFFQKKNQSQGGSSAEKPKLPLPLDDKFLQDKELVYFIQRVFSGYDATSSDRFVHQIITGLTGLRETG